MSGAFAYLPNFHKADALHQSALALSRSANPSIDPSTVLDQATSLGHDARPAEACEPAAQTFRRSRVADRRLARWPPTARPDHRTALGRFAPLAARARRGCRSRRHALLWRADGWGHVYAPRNRMGRDRLLRHACDGAFLNGYYTGEVTAVAHLHETIAPEAMRVFLDVAQC